MVEISRICMKYCLIPALLFIEDFASCHHIPVCSARHTLSKQCMSEVCSQHALCAYMWITLAREQCSST